MTQANDGTIDTDLSMLPRAVNRRFFPLLWDRHRFLVIMGGAGSGKSVFAAQKLLTRIVMERGHNFVVLRKVARTQRHSTFANVRSQIAAWGWTNHFRVNKSDMVIEYPKGRSQILFLGLDDVEKLKSIDRISGVWIEEATETAEDELNQIDLRLRGRTPGYKQIVLTFNPVSANHWLKRRFWDSEQHGRTKRMRTTYRDNDFLDAEYATVLHSLKDVNYQMWRIYAEGLWGVLKGLIYDTWITLDAYPKHMDERIYGIDFGFNNPSALVEAGIKDRRDIYVTQHVYESNLTTADLMARMGALGLPKTGPYYADSAEPDRIEDMCRDGWNVLPANKGPGSVRAGIDFLKSKRLHTMPSNADLNKEAAAYAWAEDKNGVLLEEPVKYMDHALDALRYAVHTHLSTPQFEMSNDAFAGLGIFST